VHSFVECRVGGVAQDLPIGLMKDIYDWARQFTHRLDEIEELLSGNRIFKERTVDVGIITAKQVGEGGEDVVTRIFVRAPVDIGIKAG